MDIESPGYRFRKAVQENHPLQLVGAINALSALLAEQVGFKALYLSGAGVANASYGLPDLGMTNSSDVAEDVRRITGATSLPLFVDADTGWGTAFNIARSIREIEKAGACGVHIEDQVQAKRCGHRPKKIIVPKNEMVDRIKAATDARHDDQFVIMARTDALASEGIEAALDRMNACIEAGADMVFPEAVQTIEEYEQITNCLDVPVLANITEFGKTPLFSTETLLKHGVKIVLYPLSAFRAMNNAALNVYQSIYKDGTQEAVVDSMQTRVALYDTLNYHAYEQKLDELFEKEGNQ